MVIIYKQGEFMSEKNEKQESKPKAPPKPNPRLRDVSYKSNDSKKIVREL